VSIRAWSGKASRFHNYSFGNVLEIARQMPTATRVAGFWTWKNLGRSVNAGAKGIRILAPIIGVRRKKDEEAEKGHHQASVALRQVVYSKGSPSRPACNRTRTMATGVRFRAAHDPINRVPRGESKPTVLIGTCSVRLLAEGIASPCIEVNLPLLQDS
jgi:hypothetical protein